jgi:hypothetical protein
MNDLYDPNLSESEVEARLITDTAQTWMAESAEGRTFAALYNTAQNRQKLANCFALLDEAVTLDTLSGAFRKLVASGAIQTDAERQAAQEQALRQCDEINRAKWEADCEAWIESHSTREITERAETDRAFRSYLKAANRIPQLPVEYSAEATARQQAAKKVQKQRDARFANVPDELWTFAETYKRLPAAEAFKRMTEPPFKAAVEACAKVGLL